MADPDESSRDEILISRPGVIGRGGNGGHQALNIAVQFGAHNILGLLDYHGEHWHAKHPQGLSNPRPQVLAKWARRMNGLAPLLNKLGVTFIDVTTGGALTAYPKMSIDDALAHFERNGNDRMTAA
jgi:hypothetical protein